MIPSRLNSQARIQERYLGPSVSFVRGWRTSTSTGGRPPFPFAASLAQALCVTLCLLVQIFCMLAWLNFTGAHGKSNLISRMAHLSVLCRQDTWSDLQLFMALNVALVLLGGYVKGTFLDSTIEKHGFVSVEFWERVYSVSGPLLPRSRRQTNS